MLTTLPIGFKMEDRLVKEVEIRGMDGYARKIITDVKGGKNPAKVATALIGRCVCVDGKPIGDKLARQMFVVDRNAVIMGIQRESYGDIVNSKYTCSWCRNSFETEDDLSLFECKTGNWQDSIDVTLTRGYVDSENLVHREVTLRFATGIDEELTNHILTQNYQEWCSVILVRLITRFGDLDMSKFAGLGVKVIDSLPVKDIDTLIKAVTENLPGYDLKHDVVCPECGRQSGQTLDMSGFFIPV